MSIEGAVIRSGAIGVNTIGGDDSVSAIIASGVAVTDTLNLGETYTLYSPDDAVLLGIDASYDASNEVVLYRHIEEFYRLAGKGTKLFLMVVDQALDPADVLEDTGVAYAKKVIIDSKGSIMQLGLAFNPPSGYTATQIDGLDSKIEAAIAKAQGLHQWSDQTHRPLNVIIEGRGFSGTAAAAKDLRAIPSLNATHVSLVIAQDYEYASGLAALNQKYADVGTCLGAIASRAVNENIGEVETMNLTDAITEKWLTAGFSSHEKASDRESDWSTLDTKGYIFGMTYTGEDGVRFNDDHTCCEIIQDAEGNLNEHNIAYGRTMNKAKRLLRKALLPRVKSTQPVDPNTGNLPMIVVKDFEAKGDEALGRMIKAQELSGAVTVVDPTSNLLIPPKELRTAFSIVPYGTIGQISGTINLKNKIE